MRAVVDSAAWISLDRAHLADVVGVLGIRPVVLDVVRAETLGSEHVVGLPVRVLVERAEQAVADGRARTTDEAVLYAADEVGTVVTNDIALGRRASRIGASWLRTADLVALAVRTGAWPPARGRKALASLRAAGRISAKVAAEFEEDFR